VGLRFRSVPGLGTSAARVAAVVRSQAGGLDRRAFARRVFAAVALLFAAFSSLATSRDYCPQAVSLSDTATVVPGAPVTQHYTATGGAWKIYVLVRGQSAEAAEVRVHLEADDLTCVDPSVINDAGPSQAVALVLQPGVESTAEVVFGGCSRASGEAGFAVVIEHVAGAEAMLSWEVFAETDSCEGNEFDVLIERR